MTAIAKGSKASSGAMHVGGILCYGPSVHEAQPTSTTFLCDDGQSKGCNAIMTYGPLVIQSSNQTTCLVLHSDRCGTSG
jgi:hypothetical protein